MEIALEKSDKEEERNRAARRKSLAGNGLKWLLALSGLLLISPRLQAEKPLPAMPLRAVIVGGGPNLSYNQVAIESNVRYVGKLLPTATLTTLFADGSLDHSTVQFEDAPRSLTSGERLLDLVFYDPDTIDNATLHYRKPNLGVKLDGPCVPDALNGVFSGLVRESRESKEADSVSPLLLYFTGHGSPGDDKFENNVYDMWGDKELSVRQLAQQMARLPDKVPVTLIMVQCHSGAFANLLFEGGLPEGKPVAREFAGFFASTADRAAAGCTSEADEAEYRDFTSYFFAALTGRDRLNRRVTGADFNGDGVVGMDEAFCYTLANDRSIDAPVCTSDIFLRRFVKLKPKGIAAANYRSVRSWASPAQRYALDMLAKSLHRERGENRLAVAAQDLKAADDAAAPDRREQKRALNAMRTQAQRGLLARWPDLRDPALTDFALARTQAIAYLTQNANGTKWKALLDADDALMRKDADSEAQDIAEAHLQRFVWLGESIVRAHLLAQTGDAETKARFARLLTAERRSILPPADK